MSLDYRVIKSRRKTIAIIIRSEGAVEVRAPMHCSQRCIAEYISRKRGWITQALERNANAIVLRNFSDDDLEKMKSITAAKAEDYLRSYPGKKPALLRIRKQKSVWGTCNGKGIITLNSLAGLLPEPLFEYVLIHELTHLEVLNHSEYFWNLVSYYVPDWKERREELKKYRIGD